MPSKNALALILPEPISSLNFFTSKIIFSGDFKQTDLIKSNKDQTAFHSFLEVARKMPSFQEIYFTPDDIVRSSLVKQWIVACEDLGY